MIDPVAHSTPARAPTDPADLAIGAFTPHAPWIVDPDAMPWRFGARRRARRRRPCAARPPTWPAPGPTPAPALGAAGCSPWPAGSASALLAVGLRTSGAPPTSRAGLSRRLRPAFEHLGPTYIKLGQIISSGEGIFPEELVDEFRLLRDRVPPEPFAVVRRTIEEDLGRPLAEVFTSFDRVPIASASIAQVHAATLRTGERVVVKVQRRTVAPLVRLDIAAMAWIAPLPGRPHPGGRPHQPAGPGRAVRRDHRGGARLPARGPEHAGHRRGVRRHRPARRSWCPGPIPSW